jgi:glycosyltransferase involved in cell wall biosynthesis
MPPSVSIVIPAHNEGKRISKCLEALRRQTLRPQEYEVIVIDDGSEDDTAAVASSCGARVIRQQNRGPAAARNAGIDQAGGAIVLFLDADCVAEEHWAERLRAPIADGTAEGAVGRIVSGQDRWVATLIQAELDERYVRAANHERVDLLNTGNCGFKRDVLRDNRFDEAFRWIEDAELSFRLTRDGHRMVFVQDAVVEHSHPESLRAYLLRKFRYASFAPSVSRLYPKKALSDSRSAPSRRLQLLLVALALASAPAAFFSPWIGFLSLGFFAAGVLLSLPVYVRAGRRSLALGFCAPLFILMGNIAFVCGLLRGIALLRFAKSAAARL